MRIAGVDDVSLRDRIEHALGVAHRHPRRDVHGPDQHGHGRGDLRGVSAAQVEEEIVRRVAVRRQRCRVLREWKAPHEELDGARAVDGRIAGLGQARSEFQYARRKFRQLDIALGPDRIRGGRAAQLLGRGRRQRRVNGVHEPLANPAGGPNRGVVLDGRVTLFHLHLIRPIDPQGVARREQNGRIRVQNLDIRARGKARLEIDRLGQRFVGSAAFQQPHRAAPPLAGVRVERLPPPVRGHRTLDNQRLLARKRLRPRQRQRLASRQRGAGRIRHPAEHALDASLDVAPAVPHVGPEGFGQRVPAGPRQDQRQEHHGGNQHRAHDQNRGTEFLGVVGAGVLPAGFQRGQPRVHGQRQGGDQKHRKRRPVGAYVGDVHADRQRAGRDGQIGVAQSEGRPGRRESHAPGRHRHPEQEHHVVAADLKGEGGLEPRLEAEEQVLQQAGALAHRRGQRLFAHQVAGLP